MSASVTALALLWLAAQSVAAPPTPVCSWADAPDGRATIAMPGGFTATLARSSERSGGEDACRMTVTDGGGTLVFDRTGFGARVFAGTGQDLDGDGGPEAVLGVDEGGGNRCCWRFTVVHLRAGLPVLAELPFVPGIVAAPNGGVLFEEVEAYYDLGPSMAESPVVIRFHRFERGQLVERTRDYCDSLLSTEAVGAFARPEEWVALTAARRAASRQARDTNYEVSQTRVAAMSMALQFHACGRPAGADALVADVWPMSDVAAQQRRLAAAARRP